MSIAFGVDIGGSGIKCAPVDLITGNLLRDRERLPTAENLTREGLESNILEVLKASGWTNEPVGIAFPGVIRHGVIATAVNLGEVFVGWNLLAHFSELLSVPVTILNDADAAGLAEMKFGAGKDKQDSLVLLLTIGTGIGTVLFYQGKLIPNLELGHVEFNGKNAESLVSERVRKEEDLSWKRWGKRLNKYLQYVEHLLQTDRIILGGGGAKKREKFEEYLSTRSVIDFAYFGNQAGIVGAALSSVEGGLG